ncbi:hypothetical protein COW36_01540 [bacterium (Candidatus Blackallbacteria) CG17_big_fil_post_rev_8_21_14_2_50_48_46]|uniref:histidine kinase n=1 Tax=bacterium (Candidatus Blackallbacteria) CG17_big_fil_post_rev_8_21_14_2_50_48_46 TaxID=2014261 RepID=A0A2M7GBJ1_9BACT|nr:MAG: hypothetical protein COW64_09635 [bacterium (Candidatus Blackallbacteria) CG18_big_fil_WC_8_21_14_2_50_49_26]PIW19548.1 MAG: hypothetical protein COW36_01540 [bacterium (Candidatus Blackallbacteria) CG17_big_fil_post_rev_8_21_14_2_50_48_46]PIW48849.1 MAG: hypothetical protein COW20_06915 [bacterium (Candidatus Blackallbacteria) CG13_big_fil_rev_8_21_14_2_50_49_14]
MPRFSLPRIYLLVLLVSVTLLGLLTFLFQRFEERQFFVLPAHQWEYATTATVPAASDWKPAKKLQFSTALVGKDLWLRTTLPAHELRDPTLFVRRINQNFEVKLGPQQIYHFGDLAHAPARFNGYLWHMISLPTDNVVKTLFIRIHSEHRFIGMIGDVQFGSRGQLIRRLIFENLGTFMLGGFYLLAAAVALCLALFLPERPLSLSLGLFCLFQGCYILCESDLTGLWFYQPLLLTTFSLFSLYLMPIWIYLFLQRLSAIESLNRPLQFLAIVHLVFVGLSGGSVLLGLPLMQTVFPFQILSLISLLFLGFLVLNAWKHLQTSAHLVAMGMLVFIGAALYDMLVAIRVLPWGIQLYPWGSFMFVFSLFLVLLGRFWKIYHHQLWVAAELQLSLAAQKELRLAKEAAEAANQLKTQFLANLSHEIRTPLNAVLGFAELLEEDLTDPQHRHYLEAIRSGGKSLLGLLNDLLDLSKIESGQMQLELQWTDLQGLCYEMGRMFSLPLQKKGLEWRMEFSPEVPALIKIDELRMRQILLNLIGNAIKFTESGCIILSVARMKGESREICISVSDTGIGIGPDAQSLIFEPFRQQDGQSTRKYGGTGLGLAICRRLAGLMGGRIELSSQLGKGSTFSLCFPVTEEQSAAEQEILAVEEALPRLKVAGQRFSEEQRLYVQGRLEPLYQDLKKNRNLNRMKGLAQACLELGERFGCEELTGKGKALESALLQFDILCINELFEALPQLWLKAEANSD